MEEQTIYRECTGECCPRHCHVVATWRYGFHVTATYGRHVEVRGFAPIDLKEFVLSKVFFLDGFVAPRFLNTVAERGPPRPGAALSPRRARDPGNKAAVRDGLSGTRYSGSGDIGYWFVDFRGPKYRGS
jgi:hypothetical protein